MKQTIIEPCCITRQLPELMKSAKQGMFYSNGDWSVKQLMQAVSFMVTPHATVVLLLPTVDVYFCRLLVEWIHRDWMEGVIIATKENCTEVVKKELSSVSDKVLYLYRKNLSIEAFIRYNDTQRIALFGPIRIKGDNTFSSYSYVRNISLEEFAEVVNPIVSLFVSKKQAAKKKDTSITDFVNRAFLPSSTPTLTPNSNP